MTAQRSPFEIGLEALPTAALDELPTAELDELPEQGSTGPCWRCGDDAL